MYEEELALTNDKADGNRLESLIGQLAPMYGPSGYEGAVRDALIELVKPLCDDFHVDALGNLIAHCAGTGEAGSRRVMVAAHMDEIGLMITHIDDEGFLRFAPIGGVNPATLLGQQVQFADGTIGAIGVEKLDNIKDLKMESLFIDIGATSKAEALERVDVGSAATYMRPVARSGQRLIGKALDDRVGCAIAIETMHHLKEHPSPHDVYFVFSVQEEVGLRGARTAAYGISPDVGIALDVTATGDTPKSMHLAMRLGAGTAIKVKDMSLITHPRLRQLLIDTAETQNIPYQMEVLPYGGTDAGAIHLTKTGVPSAVLSIPTRYLHTPAEMIDVQDAAATSNLLTAFLQGPIEIGSP